MEILKIKPLQLDTFGVPMKTVTSHKTLIVVNQDLRVIFGHGYANELLKTSPNDEIEVIKIDGDGLEENVSMHTAGKLCEINFNKVTEEMMISHGFGPCFDFEKLKELNPKESEGLF